MDICISNSKNIVVNKYQDYQVQVLWLIMGDLDELSNSSEKCSAYQGNSTRYAKFIMFSAQRFDWYMTLEEFTWYNKRKAVNAIFARLDRA